MFHFFAEHENIHKEYIDIVGSDVNHIKNVVRLKAGDKILISSGDNYDYNCTISEMTADYIRADIDSVNEKGNELKIDITLYQGLPKSDKMELIIQKAVELGCNRIVPVAMKRSVVKLDDKKAKSKVERSNNIALSAAKQSKRSIIPVVSEPMSYKAAIEEAAGDGTIILPYESAEGMKYTREIISSIKTGDKISIFIGPEGGFDLEEIGLARDKDAKIITLGKRILRTETAGMVMLSILMYEFEE